MIYQRIFIDNQINENKVDGLHTAFINALTKNN